jgi:hypothetical protein
MDDSSDHDAAIWVITMGDMRMESPQTRITAWPVGRFSGGSAAVSG